MYNYYDAVTRDIYDFLKDNFSPEEIREMDEDRVVDIVYNEDEVTGCDNGYDYSEVVADYVRDNLKFALECAYECGFDLKHMISWDDIYLGLDSNIRNYILYECARQVLQEFKDGAA